jgi:NAD(P)H dehydrogenase (quinone)
MKLYQSGLIRQLSLCVMFLTLSFLSQSQPVVLVTYHSETGNTEAMARAVAEGASMVDGIVVTLKAIDQVSIPDLLNAQAIIVGSPVYNANVSPEIQKFISSWPFEGAPMKDKIGAAFVTAGGISAGEEITQMNILQSMLIFGMIVVGGSDWRSPFGASAIVGEQPFDGQNTIDEIFLEKGRKLGERVSNMALKFNK